MASFTNCFLLDYNFASFAGNIYTFIPYILRHRHSSIHRSRKIDNKKAINSRRSNKFPTNPHQLKCLKEDNSLYFVHWNNESTIEERPRNNKLWLNRNILRLLYDINIQLHISYYHKISLLSSWNFLWMLNFSTINNKKFYFILEFLKFYKFIFCCSKSKSKQKRFNWHFSTRLEVNPIRTNGTRASQK